MTLLVAWCGVDTRGPASVYFAADSRISWSRTVAFDSGRKVFAFKSYPDIVGYCGDALFPSMAVAQIVEMADNGLLFTSDMSCKKRFEAFKEKLVQQFQKYPQSHVARGMFQVLYASRELSNHRSFFCHLIEWQKSKGWSGKNVPLPNSSSELMSLGSGAQYFRKNLARYKSGPTKSTSRAIFHCFCNTLFSNVDPHCGGAPQLVGIYCKRGSSSQQYGIVRSGKRYLYGVEVDRLPSYNSVEWRNDLFERVDGNSMGRLDGAQPQPDPLRTS